MPLTETLKQIQDRLGLPPTLGVFMDSRGNLYDLKEEFNLMAGNIGSAANMETEHMGLPKQVITQNGSTYTIDYGTSEYQGGIVGATQGYHKSRFRVGINLAGEALTPVTWASLSAGLSSNTQGGIAFNNSATSLGSWANGGYSSQEFNNQALKLEVTLDALSRTAMIGLGKSWALNNSYVSIDYALYLVNPLMIYEAGTSRGYFGTNNIGDKIALEIRGNRVVYSRNGATFYESTIPLTNGTPYRFDASINTTGHLIPNAKFTTDTIPAFDLFDIEGLAGEPIKVGDIAKASNAGMNILAGSTYDKIYASKATGSKFTGQIHLTHTYYVTEQSSEVSF